MDDSKKLEALENLRTGVWREFDSLRNHEWKVALTLWSSLAVLIGSILIHPVNISWESWVASFGLIIICLHGWYILGVARNQKINRLKEDFFVEKITSLLSIKEYTSDICQEIEKIQEKKDSRKKYGCFAPLFHWSTGFQFWFTVFLVIVIFAVNFSKNHYEASQKVIVDGSLKINGFPTDIQALPTATPVKALSNSNEKGPEGRLKPRP